jgi:anti-sigma-K factor RskA
MTNTQHDIANEAHRAGCAECKALWAELDAISDEARALPKLTPSRDLWSGIEARIGGAATSSNAAGRAARRWTLHPAVRLATAASLLVAATAAVTWRIANEPDVEPPLVRAAEGNDSLDAMLPGGMVGVLRASTLEGGFTSVDQEIRTLQLVVDRRSDRLDPVTLAVLKKNLALIDQAIAESRAALANDPASRFLAAQLARAYGSKLTLLRESATIPAGT